MDPTFDSLPLEEVREPCLGSMKEEPQAKYKSFKYVRGKSLLHLPLTSCSSRKKYNKMRYIFKDKMRESTALFNEEQKAIKTAHRLLEQNQY